jgi:hypothetical protein
MQSGDPRGIRTHVGRTIFITEMMQDGTKLSNLIFVDVGVFGRNAVSTCTHQNFGETYCLQFQG